MEATGVVSMHFEPIVGDPDRIGVLAVGWNERAEALSEHVAGAVRTLAAEAAIALERAVLLASLEASARTDDLTGLPSRRAWEERLPRELARARRERHSVCVVMLDLDRFKDFNYREGHQAGDRLLKLCAASWATSCGRPTSSSATAARSSPRSHGLHARGRSRARRAAAECHAGGADAVGRHRGLGRRGTCGRPRRPRGHRAPRAGRDRIVSATNAGS